MKRLILLTVLSLAILAAQRPGDPGYRRLPDGRKQSELILKSNHEKVVEESEELLDLARELNGELEEKGHNVLSVSALEKAKEIEKLSKKIQKRLKRY